MSQISVLIVTDQLIPRLGLAHIIRGSGMFTLAGEADCRNAPGQTRKLRPGVVLIHAPGSLAGLVGLLQGIRDVSPQTAIAVFGRDENPFFCQSVFEAGAEAYVLIRSEPALLFSAIDAAAHGKRFVDPNLNNDVVDLLLANAAPRRLSMREGQVLGMLALGYTNQQIAGQLSLSPKSVQTYRSRLAHKLHLYSRVDIVHYALSMGLLQGR